MNNPPPDQEEPSERWSNALLTSSCVGKKSTTGGLCRGEVCAGLWLQQEFGKHTLAGRPGGKKL